MSRINRRYLILPCIVFLPACTIKGYRGPELTDNQVATIALKAPAISRVPLFWIFPLNMLTWFSEDWFATSWGPNISVENISRDNSWWKPTTALLDRFTSIKVLPGEQSLKTTQSAILHKEQNGNTSYSYGYCSCTEKEVDKKKKTVCEQTNTSTTPYRVTAQDRVCRLSFTASAGRQYEAYIRDNLIMLQNSVDQHIDKSDCYWGTPYTYETTESISSTSSCSK